MTQSTTRSTPTPLAPTPPAPPPKERRRLREGKAMTVKQLAATVGVAQSTVKSWETGRSQPSGRKGEQYVRLLAVFALEVAAAEEAEDAAAAARAAAERAETERQAVARQIAQLESVRLAVSAAASASDGGTVTAPAARPDAAGTQAPVEEPDEPRTTTDAGTGAGAGAGADTADTADTAIGADTGPGTGTDVASDDGGAAPADAEAAHPDAGARDADTVADAGGADTGAASGAGDADTGAADADADAAPRRVVNLDKASDGFGAGPVTVTPEQAFDALYAYASPALVRQAYLLTGHRGLARESVERAFQLAWQRWPEVAVDRDPASWVRAAVHEYALSPWHRFRTVRGVRVARPGPDAEPVPVPNGRALREALLALPPSYRRAMLLYDGLGLDLPDAAAEAQSSTPATASRVLHAREAVAARAPELSDAGLLHDRLDGLARWVAVPSTAPARSVRRGSERRVRMWTRAAIVLTVLIVSATIFTLLTAPRQYNAPEAPPERVTGVPLPGGPQPLTPQDLKLRDKLDAVPLNGPERLLPRPG
ncbi:helix-turn-helix domain-containing protein [Streptomyces sp. NBC_01497]|uniref:helix-turn-helix domain-containing protein n=1 Tax=Streptomyces sp. NBC_01497 TaxID=2903885 RepID=UPI002E356FED|nr:helix-turn-helix domain-containing protein [Streptomyces sp. NBC_01497]